jgi:urea transport system permease protein
LLPATAHAAIDASQLKALAGDDPDARIVAVNTIAALANDEAAKVLTALKNEELYFKDDQVFLPDGEQFIAWPMAKKSPYPMVLMSLRLTIGCGRQSTAPYPV